MISNPHGTILLVEDEAPYRRIYKDAFQHEGYTVLEAVNGAEGVKIAKANIPDLILLDIILPEMNGLDVLKELRASKELARTPVMMFSVLGAEEDLQKCIESGADDYIVKGEFVPSEVLVRVKQLLRKSREEPPGADQQTYITKGKRGRLEVHKKKEI